MDGRTGARRDSKRQNILRAIKDIEIVEIHDPNVHRRKNSKDRSVWDVIRYKSECLMITILKRNNLV